jgi:hypothetical protein
VPVINQFVSTEGLAGQSEPGGSMLDFASDMCLVELVAGGRKPTMAGARRYSPGSTRGKYAARAFPLRCLPPYDATGACGDEYREH